MIYRNIIYLIVSFLVGVFLSSHFLVNSLNYSFILFFIFLCFLLFFFLPQKIRIIPILCVACLVGFLYFFKFQTNTQKHTLDYFAQNNISLHYTARIIDRPIKKNNNIQMKVKILSNEEIPTVDAQTNVLVKISNWYDVSYGQEIKFSAIPIVPQEFTTDTGRIFDYPHYLEKDHIFYIMKPTSVDIVSEPKKNILFYLYSLKDIFLKKIYQILPQPESSLLAGVLLGEDTALGSNIEDAFRDTGLMHIVVLSGYNVSIVIMAIMVLLSSFPLPIRSFVTTIGIVLFALLVGAGPTVVRASLMAFFLVLGNLIGRDYHFERGLIFAAFLMVLYNPFVLYFDISFQLSFLATYGLMVFPDVLEKYVLWIPEFFYFRESLVATLSAQIMVAPLIIYYMGSFSLVAPIVNMLVLFMVPLVMLFGFLMVVISFIMPFVVPFFMSLSYLGLAYILMIVDIFSKIPFSHINFPPFSFWYVVLCYVVIFLIIYFFKLNNKW